MGFLKRLFGGDSVEDRGMYFYVRCTACREPIRVRVDPMNDLSPVYEGDEDEETAYEVRKQLLGTRCYKLIEGHWRFDKRKRLIGSEIEGGNEITAAEYEAETAASVQQP